MSISPGAQKHRLILLQDQQRIASEHTSHFPTYYRPAMFRTYICPVYVPAQQHSTHSVAAAQHKLRLPCIATQHTFSRSSTAQIKLSLHCNKAHIQTLAGQKLTVSKCRSSLPAGHKTHMFMATFACAMEICTLRPNCKRPSCVPRGSLTHSLTRVCLVADICSKSSFLPGLNNLRCGVLKAYLTWSVREPQGIHE